MAIGDKAAAKNLAVFTASQLVSRVFEYLNTRGDEIATLMDRVTTNETNAKTPDTIYTAAATGGTGADTLQSVTELLTVPAKAYDRTVTITFRTMLTQLDANYADVRLRKNQATTLASIRVSSANTTASGAFTEKIPANTAVKYQLAVQSPNSKTWTATNDNGYTDLTVAAKTI